MEARAGQRFGRSHHWTHLRSEAQHIVRVVDGSIFSLLQLVAPSFSLAYQLTVRSAELHPSMALSSTWQPCSTVVFFARIVFDGNQRIESGWPIARPSSEHVRG